MGRDDRRRAVVTGMGAITPIGNDVPTFWSNLTGGVSGVARIASYDPAIEEVQIAAEIKGFDPATWMDFKQARRMSRFSQIAVASAAQAIADAGLEISDANRDDIAVIVNTGGGGIGDVVAGERVFLEQGGKRVSPFMVPMLSPSMAACQISIQNKLRGPVITSVAACASGVQAFVEAQRLIEHGDVDVAIAGGTESAILPVAFAALANMGALSMRDAAIDPEQVDYIVAHGTSTPLNDATESKAIHGAFGDRAGKLAVSSNKSMIGHTLGAAGAVSALVAALAIRDAVVPPTINYE